MIGWITLSRDIQRHWLWNNPEQLKAWIAILMAANWERTEVPCGIHITVCDRGQCIRSQEQWAKIFGKEWDRSKVQRFFKLLQNASMIRTEIAHKALKLTVVNYDTYQDVRAQVERNVSASRAQRERNVSTENNNNNLTIKQPKPKTLKQRIDALALSGGYPSKKALADKFGIDVMEKASSGLVGSKRWPSDLFPLCEKLKPQQQEIQRRPDGTILF